MAGKGFRRQPGMICTKECKCHPIRLVAQHTTMQAHAGGLLDAVYSHPVWAETPPAARAQTASNSHDVHTAACPPHTR